jgi:hypothetical protein
MLDFRPKSSRTTNYFARGEQRKLLLLVLSAGLVIFLVEEAAHPQRWLWMWQAAGQQAAPPAAGNAARRAKVEQPAALRRKTKHVDEFIAEAAAPEALPVEKTFFPGVQPELLAHVRDDTVFRAAESDAFYHLLKVLDQTSEKALEDASLGPVSFTQLFTQPKEYRGDLVTVSGTVRRVLEKHVPKNKYGVQQYSQVVIEPDDREYPMIINCLDLPEGFPRGEKLHEPATITGFFYKRWAGMSQGKEIMTYPMLFSKTLRWQPQLAAGAAAAQGGAIQADLNRLMGGVAFAIVASLAVVAFVLGRTRRKTRFVMPQAKPGELDRLRDEEVMPDVRHQLAELARQEQP